MELKNGEVRIFYRTEVGEIDAGLDLAIEEALAKHGYYAYGAGFDRNTDVRDMDFDREHEDGDVPLIASFAKQKFNLDTDVKEIAFEKKAEAE